MWELNFPRIALTPHHPGALCCAMKEAPGLTNGSVTAQIQGWLPFEGVALVLNLQIG